MFEWLPNPLLVPIGLAVGVLIAAPVGPVNVMCIQRAVERGPFGGVPAGLGAVLADGLIALAAALGVGAVTTLVAAYRDGIQIVGGLALLLFAVVLLRRKSEIVQQAGASGGAQSLAAVIWDLPQAFFLTMTNPAAVLGLVAIFGGISTFVEVDGWLDAVVLVAMIMAGSFGWWLGLSVLVGRLRERLRPGWVAWINVAAGVALLVFAIALLGEVAIKYLTGVRLA